MTFASFDAPHAAGFEVLAGRSQGLQRLMVAAGRLPSSDVGIVHVHHGDEVLRVVSGEILVRCGDSRRVCGPGDLIVVPPDMPHGFRVLEETVMEVVAEYDIGTLYPVTGAGGAVELVEVYRPDLPWGRRPPPGKSWTSDAELDELRARLAFDV